ncbi:Acm Lyzozyme M1 (1,4-beta-N-acetylmuramidase) [uncultured Caudovirales phage]|uniref:lysozyme n=1 Tax=uncultured Caudovirales phage TaxID=2100421 RepID=A0A6J5RZ71_9CAUD|nr:Acm Lyzozyme M1 (1,4-beta-N-acetylmuramidase) [uncultured Caudovirales phage]
MSRVSRALWKRRLTYRQKRVSHWRAKGNIVKVNYWLSLVREAKHKLAPVKPLHGIDVFEGDGKIDWIRARSKGVEFVFLKCSEGGDFRDKAWTAKRVKEIRASGIPFGPYHFLRPRAGRRGEVEARFFIETARKAGWGKGDLRPVIDFEVSDLPPSQTIRYLEQAVKEVKRLTGKPPIIYTGGPFWDENGGGRNNWGCPLWLAAYVAKPNDFVPRAWKTWTIWQYTDKGGVAGVEAANVDQNLAHNLPKL